jgi:hypothetical protein
MPRDNLIGTIFYSRATQVTARKLSRLLRARHDNIYHGDENYVIWWGSSYLKDSYDSLSRRVISINNPNSVSKMADKLSMLKLFRMQHIKFPKCILSQDEFLTALREPGIEYPYIARPVYHHGGRYFYFVNNIKEANMYLERGYILSKFIPNVRNEYRIMFWGEYIFECDIKKPLSEESNTDIKNHDNGWIFTPMNDTKPRSSVISAAREAHNASGLHFSAVDCCITEDNKPYIFEVNSAPGLINRKLVILAENIKTCIVNNGFIQDCQTAELCQEESDEQHERQNQSICCPQHGFTIIFQSPCRDRACDYNYRHFNGECYCHYSQAMTHE